MIATIMKFVKKPSRNGGIYFHTFLKSDDGKSYYTYLAPKMRNWSRWKKVMKVGIILSGLRLVKGKKNLIDADSRFEIVKE